MHGGFDRFVGIGHRVEFLVALLDAEQNADGVRFVGRRNFDGLEAALERTVLLDGLAIFARRGGADALDLAARKSGLQDIGGIERTFGRSGAHQGVQLIDEDDGVLILHQLLHDGFQPLFELAAIFRAGDDERKIESQDALVGQERRHVAIGDALGQAFHDGGFADARLADQHRIVLGAAAQDLHHALQLVIAADQRIERAIHGGLREIAAELGQQRAFLGAAGGDLFRRRALNLFAHLRKAQSALMQDFGGKTFLFAQQAEQQMLGADVLVIQALGFFGAIGEHTLAFVAEREIHRGGHLLPNGGVRFNLLANGFDGGVGPQEPIREALCPPAADRATDAPSRYRDFQTGWLRILRRRLLGAPFLYNVQT